MPLVLVLSFQESPGESCPLMLGERGRVGINKWTPRIPQTLRFPKVAGPRGEVPFLPDQLAGCALEDSPCPGLAADSIVKETCF
jgi:hypothetical protein